VRGNAGQVNYSSAKAAVTGMTRTLAKEWGRYAVTVNCVAFGYIQTRLTKPLAEGEAGTIEGAGRQVKVGVQGNRIATMNQMIPLGRGGFPEEAAGAVYLFCSPDSDFVSGQTLVVTGGALLGRRSFPPPAGAPGPAARQPAQGGAGGLTLGDGRPAWTKADRAGYDGRSLRLGRDAGPQAVSRGMAG